MNKKIVALGCFAAFAATSSLAYMGTGVVGAGQFGLPMNWNITATRGYGAALLNGNPASAMCVECHSVNPSSHILDVENAKGIATLVPLTARSSILVQGSHAVINDLSITPLTSNSGGGWDITARNGGEYLKNTTWTTPAGTPFSKVEDAATVGLNSGLAGGAGAIAAGDQGMICESCHSVRFNVLTAADNDLLLAQYQDNTIDTICTACHNGNAGKTMAVDNGNLVAFDGASVKRHHVVTGSTLIADGAGGTHYKVGGTSSLMWAPYASDSVTNAWCAAPYTVQAATTKLDINGAGVGIAFRDACNVAGQGTRAVAGVVGDIAPTGAAAINCANCHRPHNAMTTGGAFILRSGKLNGANLDVFNGNDAAGAAAGMNVDKAGSGMYYGIRRQSDVGSYATKVYGEYVQLCNGCHVGYNQ